MFVAALCFPKGILAQSPIRVNCGGASYTDSKGQVWQADPGYHWGNVSSIPAVVSGTSAQALCQNGRYNPNFTSRIVYPFSLPHCQYHLTLYFPSTYSPTHAQTT